MSTVLSKHSIRILKIFARYERLPSLVHDLILRSFFSPPRVYLRESELLQFLFALIYSLCFFEYFYCCCSRFLHNLELFMYLAYRALKIQVD